jgi:hypothetical protein
MRRQPGAHLAPLACLLLVLAPGRGAAQPAQDCSRTSSLVGRIIQLQGAPGNLTVLDDCSFEVHLYRHGGPRFVCHRPRPASAFLGRVWEDVSTMRLHGYGLAQHLVLATCIDLGSFERAICGSC